MRSRNQTQRPVSRTKLGRWLFLASLLPLPWAVSLAGTAATSAGHSAAGVESVPAVDDFAMPADEFSADEATGEEESGLLLWWEEQMSEEPAGSAAARWWSDLVGRCSKS